MENNRPPLWHNLAPSHLTVLTVTCQPQLPQLSSDLSSVSYAPLSSPIPSMPQPYSTPFFLFYPPTISLSPGCHSQWWTCLSSYMPTVHLYPSNHLFFGWGAPCGAGKQDARGMSNKNSRLSSSPPPFSHSFTHREEAILHWSLEENTFIWKYNCLFSQTLFNTEWGNTQIHSCTSSPPLCIYVCMFISST